MNVTINNKKINLTKNDYITSGGEGSVYKKNGKALKIYNKNSKMIPSAKIKELSILNKYNIINPEDIIYNNNKEIGYTMKLLSNTISLCQIFTKAFKIRNNINIDCILKLVNQFRDTIKYIHSNDILVVDLNELNFLLDKNLNDVFFIDVDSYQTKSFPATAIMESIRDRHCDYKSRKNNKNTDWFSFGIISCQMFLGIHPFKGKHIKYKTLDDRMKNNISIFNKSVSIPAAAYSVDIIPEKFKDWYYAIFEKGNRIEPPFDLNFVVNILQTNTKIIDKTDCFEFIKIKEFKNNIIKYFDNVSKEIFIVDNKIIIDDKVINENFWNVIENNGNLYFVDSNNDFSINGKTIKVSDEHKNIFRIQNRFYSIFNNAVYEFKFLNVGNNIIYSVELVANILFNCTKIYDECLIQDLLGAYYVSLFVESNKHYQINLKELANHRIIYTKYCNKILIVIAEKNGIYYQFIFKFCKEFTEYVVEVIENSNTEINFDVLENGICMLINKDNYLELSFNNKNEKKIFNDDSLSAGKLMHKNNDALFVKDNVLYKIKIKH